jgi:hypothetical protein
MLNTEFSETTWRGLSEQEGALRQRRCGIAELEEIGIDCEFRPLTTIRKSRSRPQRGVNTARYRRIAK